MLFRLVRVLRGGLVATLLALSACDNPMSGIVVPLEGDVLFSISEGHTAENSEATILLRGETEKVFGCSNYELVTNVVVAGSQVLVRFEGVFHPELCATAIGPARVTRPLPIPVGSYDLAFVDGERAARYRLLVATDRIRVQEVAPGFAKSTTMLSWRYPRRSFAFLCGTMNETAWICDDFADSLLTIDGIETYEFPDSGLVPYPTAAAGFYYNGSARYFLYASDADYQEAGAMLERYTRDVLAPLQGVGLWLINYRNVWFRSWLF